MDLLRRGRGEDGGWKSSGTVRVRLGLKGSFEWQSGFGAFTIATDDVPAVSNYVNAQLEHHAMRALEPTFELVEDI